MANPQERDKIKKLIQEISDNMLIMEGYRDKIKEIKTAIKDEYQLKGRVLNEIIKMHHKQNAADVLDELDQIDATYAELFGSVQ